MGGRGRFGAGLPADTRRQRARGGACVAAPSPPTLVPVSPSRNAHCALVRRMGGRGQRATHTGRCPTPQNAHPLPRQSSRGARSRGPPPRAGATRPAPTTRRGAPQGARMWVEKERGGKGRARENSLSRETTATSGVSVSVCFSTSTTPQKPLPRLDAARPRRPGRSGASCRAALQRRRRHNHDCRPPTLPSRRSRRLCRPTPRRQRLPGCAHDPRWRSACGPASFDDGRCVWCRRGEAPPAVWPRAESCRRERRSLFQRRRSWLPPLHPPPRPPCPPRPPPWRLPGLAASWPRRPIFGWWPSKRGSTRRAGGHPPHRRSTRQPPPRPREPASCTGWMWGCRARSRWRGVRMGRRG